MRGVATAAAVGAAISALLFVGLTFGVDAYFRAVSWRETRRSIKESA